MPPQGMRQGKKKLLQSRIVMRPIPGRSFNRATGGDAGPDQRAGTDGATDAEEGADTLAVFSFVAAETFLTGISP